MARNKQFTDKMKKATLITLSVGMGAGVVSPALSQTQTMEVHAATMATAVWNVNWLESQDISKLYNDLYFESDFIRMMGEINSLPPSQEKEDLKYRAELVWLDVLERRLAYILNTTAYDAVVGLTHALKKIEPTHPDNVEAKASIEARYAPYLEKFLVDGIEGFSAYLVNVGYNDYYRGRITAYYFYLTPEKQAEYKSLYWAMVYANNYVAKFKAIEAAEKNFTGENGATYVYAMSQIKAMNGWPPDLQAYFYDRLDALVQVKLNLSNDGANVVVDYSTKLPGAESFELVRDGEVLYAGNDLRFVDTDTLGQTTYTYTVKVKDANGDLIGEASQVYTTSNYATFTAESRSGAVHLTMDYLKDETVSYEITRNGTPIYTGSANDFKDSTALGAVDYEYALNVIAGDGTVVETSTIDLKTAINNPTNLKAEDTSATSAQVTWSDKNAEETQYLVEAKPLGDVEPVKTTVVEDFESETPVLERTGTWGRSTLNKKAGENSLKSAVIGNSGITTATYAIDVPESVLDGKVSFDYMVSSEANYDWFRVVLNGKQVVRQSGLGTWKSIELALQPGKNTLMFEYKKDGSGVRGSDAAFIDNLTATSADTGIRTSGWIQEQEHEFTGLTEGIPYEFTVVAKANGLTSEVVSTLDQSNPIQEVVDAVGAISEVIQSTDLTDLAQIADAQAQLDAVKELVNALPESAEKDALLEQVNQLQETLDNAKALADATQAVDAFIESLPEELATQDAIDEATAGLNEVQELVDGLVASDAKDALVDRLNGVEEAIELAQKVLDATEAVSAVTDAVANLDSQVAIDEASALLETAKDAVALLPADHTVRVELEKELAVAEEAIDVAQAELDVAKLADAPTQAEIDQALASLEKVDAGEVKDALLEKVELAQAVLDAKNLLKEIATRDITTTEQVDQAIADLKSTDELIASLDGTFMNGEKSTLEQAYQTAKKHIADEFLALLENHKNQKGKKEKLTISMDALHLLVQQLVAENLAISKGDLKGQLQPLLASYVTGAELNDVIAVYVK